MEGFVFTISLLSILATVGGLFAWMVHMASHGKIEKQEENSKDLPN